MGTESPEGTWGHKAPSGRGGQLSPLPPLQLGNDGDNLDMSTKQFTGRTQIAASKMPPLTHWRDRSSPWTPTQSDVIAWLASQPEIANSILLKFSQSGAITFDSATGLWSGCANGHASNPTANA